MSFVAKNLSPGEEVVFETHLHWLSFRRTIILSMLMLMSMFSSAAPESKVMVIGLLVVALGVVATLEFISYKTSEFCVTSRRVVSKAGFIQRSTIEILISKMEAVEVKQSVFGRIFGYGTISAVGQGGTKNPISFVSKPLDFRKAVYAQIESNENQKRSA